jgi:hypothetical protein
LSENRDLHEIKDPLIGRVLGGNFRVDSRIGSGGMGTVYLALDQSMSRHVALKVINNLFLGDKKRIQRLITEASALAALSHPNIVKVLASHYAEDEPVFVVLEYVQGDTLANIVAANGPLSTDQFHRYFKQVVDALVHAHEHGVVHRDIKPANLMVTANGEIKILDFGLAKLLGVADQRLTQTGEILGSPHYMSPEQCGTQDVDGRTDVYSLGCTMYFALTGAPPYDGDTMLTVMFKHMNDTADLKAISDARIAAILEKCLAKDAADRFQSSEELQAALEGDRVDAPSTRRKKSRHKRVNNKLPLAVVAGVIMAALAVSTYVLVPKLGAGAPEDTRLKSIQERIIAKTVTDADAIAIEKLCKTPNLIAESTAVQIYKHLGNKPQQMAHLEQMAAIHRRDNGFKFVHAYSHASDLYALDQQKGLAAMREHLRTYENNKQEDSARRMKYLLYSMLGKTPGNEKEMAEIERQLTQGDYEAFPRDSACRKASGCFGAGIPFVGAK